MLAQHHGLELLHGHRRSGGRHLWLRCDGQVLWLWRKLELMLLVHRHVHGHVWGPDGRLLPDGSALHDRYRVEGTAGCRRLQGLVRTNLRLNACDG